jgi:SOUL heme-binding protein
MTDLEPSSIGGDTRRLRDRTVTDPRAHRWRFHRRFTPIGLIGLIVFVFWSIRAMAIEEPAYTVLQSDPPFELRAYAPMIIAEVEVEGDLDRAGSQGFRLIAGYIFGKNRTRQSESQSIAMTAPVVMNPEGAQSISMTAPVSMSAVENTQRWKMHFVMPREYQLNDLPTPLDSRVVLKQVPAKRWAVLRYSGFNTERKTQQNGQRLRDWMTSQGLNAQGSVHLARYNPPWTLPFARRNEVMLEVAAH